MTFMPESLRWFFSLFFSSFFLARERERESRPPPRATPSDHTVGPIRHAVGPRKRRGGITPDNGLRRRSAEMKLKGETADILLARSNNKARSNYIGNEDRKRDICTGRKGDGVAGGDVTMDDHIKS